jgi:hypothetical protein
MLYVFGFERIGVLVSDLYFVDPKPHPGQEGAEHGVRLEVRLLGHGEPHGSIYSARTIEAGRPLWRADLLESVAGKPGSFDRTHHHPAMNGWEPGRRVFEKGLSAAPVQWVREQLSDLEALLTRAGVADAGGFAADAEGVRGAAGEIMAVVQNLLDKVQAGELAAPPPGDQPEFARVSWL